MIQRVKLILTSVDLNLVHETEVELTDALLDAGCVVYKGATYSYAGSSKGAFKFREVGKPYVLEDGK